MSKKRATSGEKHSNLSSNGGIRNIKPEKVSYGNKRYGETSLSSILKNIRVPPGQLPRKHEVRKRQAHKKRNQAKERNHYKMLANWVRWYRNPWLYGGLADSG